jgi:Na+/H+ antiporter NhaD/arsenite permease-like protein
VIFLLGVLLITGYSRVRRLLRVGARAHRRSRRVGYARCSAPWSLRSGLLSAFFVNDTICLVLTPTGALLRSDRSG